MIVENRSEYLQDLITELCLLSNETEWVEFKENNCDPEKIGEYVSALSNSATLHKKNYAYLLWGIQDSTHALVGTNFNPNNCKIGNEPLENWLSHLLHPKVHLHFYTVEFSNKIIVILEIGRAHKDPIKFKNNEYIRVGSIKKPLRDFPEKERLLWKIFNEINFESDVAAEYISADEVIHLLDYAAYFRLMNLPVPNFQDGILEALLNDRMIAKGKHGHWDILNLGAILFSNNLGDFDCTRRKGIRIINYEGNSKLQGIAESETNKGYASGFEELMDYIRGSIPTKEIIGKALRQNIPIYPLLAIRELVANAIIHQDFSIRGAAPIIEIYGDRIEITNPGEPLLEIDRFLDNPPRSRNESLAKFMRRAGICEERGSGIDKVVALTESTQLPPPLFEVVGNNTRAVLFSHRPLNKMDKTERIRACYLHACLKYVKRELMTNTSLRERFGIDTHNMSIASRIIRETLEASLICPADETMSRKHKRYLPAWAKGRAKAI